MFPVETYFQAPVEQVDYRYDIQIATDIWIRKKGYSSSSKRWTSPKGVLKDDMLLIRVLKQIEEYGMVTIEEWTDYRRAISELPAEERIDRLNKMELSANEQIEIETLQAMFIAFRVIVWDEELSSKDKENRIVSLFSKDERPHWKPDSFINDKDICWHMVSCLTLDYEKWFSFHIFAFEDIGEIETRVTASDFFTALFYQLLMHIKAGEKGKNGATIAHCKQCGAEFIRHTAQNKYCPQCASDSARTARHRANAKQKEREDHGNH